MIIPKNEKMFKMFGVGIVVFKQGYSQLLRTCQTMSTTEPDPLLDHPTICQAATLLPRAFKDCLTFRLAGLLVTHWTWSHQTY
jgi:hypothetical protein